ncbi:ComEC/Rec2 family competence protein [Winogradskyella wichelsiae]|uniref:ComEC/Rec2 family competence protein n=1 Tax=Winogradskyella wichelsiae TaxID=2697007 RepID=UPI003EF2668B
MKLLNFTIIKLTICLISGILLAHYLKPNFHIIWCLSIVLAAFIGIYTYIIKTKISCSPIFGALVYLCMIGIGIIAYSFQDERLQSNHYTHYTSDGNYNNFIFQIKERLKPDAYNEKYIVSITSINDKETVGRLLINIKRDHLLKSYSIDDRFYAFSPLQPIQKPLNPHQFDYNKYLEFQQVYHQLYLDSSNTLRLSSSKQTIYGYADALRLKINNKLITAGFKDEALSIMNALLLGQRNTIDKTIYSNYVNSGTIHILAVSGLHVGIILLILNFILSPLLYLKYGHFIRPFILILILWSFAIIAGLKPSVTRAVMMFSIISIALHFKRRTNVYNTLVISAFIILLVQPTFLFAVGFQMSYLAVLAIVSIQPIIYKLWTPKQFIPRKLWTIFTVTLAAQFGVAPISLFYFHQFPGLFFIANVVVIPFLGLILGIGMLIIALALLNLLPKFLVLIYSYIIDALNDFIAWVAQFENFLLKDIPFTMLQVIVCYLIIITLLKFNKYKNFTWAAASLVFIIGLQGIQFYNRYHDQNDEFIIFNKSRHSIIGIKNNKNLILHHNLDTLQRQSHYAIKNYKVGESIIKIADDSLQSVYQYKGKTILVIDSLSIYKNLSFRPHYILLRNSPRLNLNRLIDSLNPEQIIADASNYKSYVKRWTESSYSKKIPFHYTNEKGAFILK